MSDDPRFHPPTLRANLVAAQAAGNFREQARLLLILAHIDKDNEDVEAWVLYAQSSAAAEKAQDFEQQAMALRFLAQSFIYFDIAREQRMAYVYFEDAIRLYGLANQTADQAYLYLEWAFWLRERGESEGRLGLYEQAVAVLENRQTWDDPERIARVTDDLIEITEFDPDFQSVYERLLIIHEEADILAHGKPD